MPIKNAMEDLVNDRILEVLKDKDCCKCEKCLDDMRALALNNIPSKYVSTHRGVLFTKLDMFTKHQVTIDLNVAVASAIESVAAKPRHDLPSDTIKE